MPHTDIFVRTGLRQLAALQLRENRTCASIDLQIKELSEQLSALVQKRTDVSAPFVKERKEIEEALDFIGESKQYAEAF